MNGIVYMGSLTWKGTQSLKNNSSGSPQERQQNVSPPLPLARPRKDNKMYCPLWLSPGKTEKLISPLTHPRKDNKINQSSDSTQERKDNKMNHSSESCHKRQKKE
jgi:Zn-finger nucleic acid-binding protein